MTLDRTKVWTGDLNVKALEPQPRITVGLYDTTLRDGEQTVGVVLAPEQKLEIATALAVAGIDRIEAGFPRVSDDDARAVSLILEAKLDAEIWGFSRAVRADVEALVELYPGPDATTTWPLITREWAEQWPTEEVWKARKQR